MSSDDVRDIGHDAEDAATESPETLPGDVARPDDEIGATDDVGEGGDALGDPAAPDDESPEESHTDARDESAEEPVPAEDRPGSFTQELLLPFDDEDADEAAGAAEGEQVRERVSPEEDAPEQPAEAGETDDEPAPDTDAEDVAPADGASEDGSHGDGEAEHAEEAPPSEAEDLAKSENAEVEPEAEVAVADAASDQPSADEPQEPAEPAAVAEVPAAASAAATSTAGPSVNVIRRRRTLVPRWLIPSVIAVAVVIGLGTAIAVRVSESRLVEVPELIGLTVDQARARATNQGLRLVRSDSRYSSSVPKGGILGQEPRPGQKVQRGAIVTVVISVGSETVQMPDVVGMSLTDARRVLESLGLQIRIERVASEEATPDVVLSSVPSPGVNVSTADVVRLAAAGAVESSSGALLPFKLEGRTFVIDPSLVSSGTPDAPMEVARRLRALLEASNARVVVTRTMNATDTSAGARAQRAAEASPTAIVGLDVTVATRGGLAVLAIPATRSTQPNYQSSLDLARAVFDALQLPSERAEQGLPADDAVAFWTPAPGVRVQLGSTAAPGDRLALTDPDRNDSVARALYRALGRLYGTRR